MSTAAAPVSRCSSRFLAGSATGASTPTIGAWTARPIRLNSLRDQTASVARVLYAPYDSRIAEGDQPETPARR